MMSSSVCQGLQSCLEPRLVEPLVLRLKLAPPKPSSSRAVGPMFQKHGLLAEPESNITQKIVPATTPGSSTVKTAINRQNSDPTAAAGWGFLEVAIVDNRREGVYVHPLSKRSFSIMLSEKSLEMCTESLGSESGSTDFSSADISIALDEVAKPPAEQQQQQQRRRNKLGGKRLSRSRSFPPPLTSISGSMGVQMRPHREGGRLILEAVTVSSSQKYLHVERSKGRLRLRLWKQDEDRGSPATEEEETGDHEAEKVEDNNANCGNVRGEIGILEKSGSGWPGRCKEVGHGRPDKGLLHHQESFLVAT